MQQQLAVLEPSGGLHEKHAVATGSVGNHLEGYMRACSSNWECWEPSGGLHEKHAVATGVLGTMSAFAYRHRETKKNLYRGGSSQDLLDTSFQPAIGQLYYTRILVKRAVLIGYRMASAVFVKLPNQDVLRTIIRLCAKTLLPISSSLFEWRSNVLGARGV